MEYPYKEMEGKLEEIRSRDGGIWSYIPARTFLETGKNKECMIFGDVTGAVGGTAQQYVSMQQGGNKKTMRLFRYRDRLSFFDKVVGFISVLSPNGNAGFVRIKKKSILKILITGMVLLAAGGITAFLYHGGPDLDAHAIAYQLPGGVKNTDPDSILLPGYDVLEMNYETQEVDAALLNPEGNDCYFKFSVTLKSDGSTMYQTGLIKPGTAVTSFKIDKKFEKGKYPIIIKVEAADMKDTKNYYNGGAIEAVLEVK